MKSVSYETIHYFAYGSNMNPERMQARGINYLDAAAGKLPGFQLRFDKQATNKPNVAYANIGYSRQGCVEGVLYRLQRAADIQIMDPFEGSPVRYSREVFPVNSEAGVINAWVYVANRAMIAQNLLPERRYLNHLLAGHPWHSEEYSRWLQNHPCIEPAVGSEPEDNAQMVKKDKDGLLFNV